MTQNPGDHRNWRQWLGPLLLAEATVQFILIPLVAAALFVIADAIWALR
jgi:hypothetical protein